MSLFFWRSLSPHMYKSEFIFHFYKSLKYIHYFIYLLIKNKYFRCKLYNSNKYNYKYYVNTSKI